MTNNSWWNEIITHVILKNDDAFIENKENLNGKSLETENIYKLIVSVEETIASFGIVLSKIQVFFNFWA